MEFRDYIEAGIAKCGTAVSLAKLLEQDATVIRNAKAHRRGLPVYACIELASLLEADPMKVISASELVTEKNERRKAIFLPFVHMAGQVQPLMTAALATTTVLMLVIANSFSTIRAFLL